jgi:hypothetical protein
MCQPVSRQSRFSLIFFLQQEPKREPEPRARIRFRFFLGQNYMVPVVPVPAPAPVPQHCLAPHFPMCSKASFNLINLNAFKLLQS